MRETIHVELMSQTPTERGWEIGNYRTTITLEVSREDAKAAIKQIVDQLAAQIYEELCADKGYNVDASDPYDFFRLLSPTRDIDGNRYCFSVEYSGSVIDYVGNREKMDIAADV